MNKEWKAVAWVGTLIAIIALHLLVNGDKESANQFVNLLFYGYIAFGFLTVVNGVYKLIKKPLHNKDSSKLN